MQQERIAHVAMALSMDREHDYENNIGYKIILNNVYRNLQKKKCSDTLLLKERSNFFYKAQIFHTHRIFLNIFFF